tara:strand:- start:1090 stop:1242 length:153 start_codon:yes stop_codon:yes gene_type:complete
VRILRTLWETKYCSTFSVLRFVGFLIFSFSHPSQGKKKKKKRGVVEEERI